MVDRSQSLSDEQAAVRRYLQWLQDPQSLVDVATVDALRAELARTVDPLAQLRLQARIAAESNPDPDAVREGFYRSAAVLAAAEQIPADAFSAMGVPVEDLRRAGLVPAGRGRPRKSRQVKSAASSTAGRQGVLDALAVLGDTFFTVRQLQEVSGASALTVRKTVTELVSAGALAEFDGDEHYAGRGRAPRRYRAVAAPAQESALPPRTRSRSTTASDAPAADSSPAGEKTTRASKASATSAKSPRSASRGSRPRKKAAS